MIKLFVCLLGLVFVSSHPYYRDRIPNGYAVSNPCGAGFWEAVGHYDPNHHTIDKNPFGLVYKFYLFIYLFIIYLFIIDWLIDWLFCVLRRIGSPPLIYRRLFSWSVFLYTCSWQIRFLVTWTCILFLWMAPTEWITLKPYNTVISKINIDEQR